MIDWDTLILAPRQRDVMFIGADEKTIYDEHQTLKHYNVLGMIQVLDYSQPLNVLLLVRAVPGAMLKGSGKKIEFQLSNQTSFFTGVHQLTKAFDIDEKLLITWTIIFNEPLKIMEILTEC